MKKRLLISTLLAATLLTGCSSEPSEPKISEEAQSFMDRVDALGEITYEDKAEVEALFTAYDGLTQEQKAEVTNFEQVREAKKEIHEYWMTHPYMFFGTDWDYSYTVTADTLGITAEDYDVSENTFGGTTSKKAYFYHPTINDKQMGSLSFNYKNDALESVYLMTSEMSSKLDNYKQLFEDYYGEPYTKTEEENAYLWISENCSVILDSTDGEISIFYYPPAKTDIDKELVESKFRAHTTKVDFKIGEIKEKFGSSGSK